ncbi:MAG: hypothetical protein HGA19_24805, partial [Oscillochloris sp.]|nr:hypothetical protein [Oscillochloris sp.]
SGGTATSGEDYTLAAGKLTFAAGETSKQIAVPIRVDTSTEPTETLEIKLQSPSGATLGTASTATVRILDAHYTQVFLPLLQR